MGNQLSSVNARTVLLTETTSQMVFHILEPGFQDIKTN